jgi:DNA excision repair protein ERCC-6
MINVKNESSREDALASQMWDPRGPRGLTNGQKSAKRIVQRVLEEGHVLVTTYSGLQTYASLLIPVDWECAILDEGHKIRNPNTAITIYCKELRTPSRIILSGTPMQNNLSELWSLFDFVFPMRLGTLVNFRNQFEFPIRQGGYANASNLQVQTASKCAETLKDAISPYLLQRFKIDVAADLPKKSEHVLFCKLTKIQRKAYEAFLGSDDMTSIMNGRRQVLYGVDILRKICNHPDLQDHKVLSVKSDYNYGNGVKSGKMQIVKSLLELWKETGHKTLLFAQHRIMLDILERFVKSLEGFKYYRMDGTTAIHARQDLVDKFNKSPDIHVFLLTTKVGGIGVNLTGADRVIIYDPDWNPSTDVQARERAWRLGQKREVKIYRLMTAGTIEEKIYHRQIFKQFLTNKILRDPKQRQTFQMKDLHDLFSLGDDGQTETSALFKDAEVTYENQGDMKPNEKGKLVATAKEERVSKKDEGEDIRNVAGVAGLERFQGEENTAADNSSPAEGSSNSEARLMEGIFARSGVQSALEHDQIIGSKQKVKADPRIIEAEAKKVAAEAAAELKRAGEMARSVPIGTPTWTGQFGVAGRPGEGMRPAGTASVFSGSSSSSSRRSAAGPSSASLLANLSNRSTATRSTATRSTATASSRSSSNTPRSGTPSTAITSVSSSSNQPRGKDFMVMIRDYLITHGGQVHTQMLIDHFNRFCTTPQATAEFKEMLKTIAVLEKGSGGTRGKWVLKPDYARRR